MRGGEQGEGEKCATDEIDVEQGANDGSCNDNGVDSTHVAEGRSEACGEVSADPPWPPLVF